MSNKLINTLSVGDRVRIKNYEDIKIDYKVAPIFFQEMKPFCGKEYIIAKQNISSRGSFLYYRLSELEGCEKKLFFSVGNYAFIEDWFTIVRSVEEVYLESELFEI